MEQGVKGIKNMSRVNMRQLYWQYAEGIQNMSEIYLIGLIFIKWKQL